MPPWMTGPTVDWRTGGEGRSEERERQAEENSEDGLDLDLMDTPESGKKGMHAEFALML